MVSLSSIQPYYLVGSPLGDLYYGAFGLVAPPSISLYSYQHPVTPERSFKLIGADVNVGLPLFLRGHPSVFSVVLVP